MPYFSHAALANLARSARMFGGDVGIDSVFILLCGVIFFQTDAALAQGAAPSEPATNDVLRACDLAAASPYDKQRPAGVPGVVYNDLNPGVAIPACDAAVRAAPQDPRMIYQLARGYRRAGRFTEALPLHQQAAEMGNALSANDLAHMYGKGEGVAVDLLVQLKYIDQAARAGLNVAEYNYGVLYEKGNAVLPKDEGLARQLVTLAANDNYPLAMNELGVMLAKGIGGSKDEVEARYWYEKAAQAGNYTAMNNFGVYLQTGKGGKQDLAEARQWYEKAANGKYAFAATNLGEMFEHGWGGSTDLEEARRFYRKAIALGEKDRAPRNLAKLDAAPGH